VLLLHPIESFVIFLFKFVLLGQKSILDQWEETNHTGTAGMAAAPLAAAAQHGIKIWPVSARAHLPQYVPRRQTNFATPRSSNAKPKNFTNFKNNISVIYVPDD
jgi:hypothetical protein